MNGLRQKQLLRDVHEWAGLQERVRRSHNHVSKEDTNVDELQIQIEKVEERLQDFSGVQMLRFLHDNRHVVRV